MAINTGQARTIAPDLKVVQVNISSILSLLWAGFQWVPAALPPPISHLAMAAGLPAVLAGSYNCARPGHVDSLLNHSGVIIGQSTGKAVANKNAHSSWMAAAGADGLKKVPERGRVRGISVPPAAGFSPRSGRHIVAVSEANAGYGAPALHRPSGAAQRECQSMRRKTLLCHPLRGFNVGRGGCTFGCIFSVRPLVWREWTGWTGVDIGGGPVYSCDSL